MIGPRAGNQSAYLRHEGSANATRTLPKQNPHITQTLIAQMVRKEPQILGADEPLPFRRQRDGTVRRASLTIASHDPSFGTIRAMPAPLGSAQVHKSLPQSIVPHDRDGTIRASGSTIVREDERPWRSSSVWGLRMAGQAVIDRGVVWAVAHFLLPKSR